MVQYISICLASLAGCLWRLQSAGRANPIACPRSDVGTIARSDSDTGTDN